MKEKEKDLYAKLGVSSQKKEVHEAIEDIDKGLFPGAFCKIVNDIAGRKDYCSIIHSDGAGTKSCLAYMYFKETGNLSIFKGLAQDATVMNVDDLLAVGAKEDMILSNIIGRNSRLISGEVIAHIINGYAEFCEKLTSMGLNITSCGGETADIPDLVRTLVVDATVFTTMKKEDVIDASRIQPSDVIVGLASDGKAVYETEINSGIGSNGLTLARHGTLSHHYYDAYPECHAEEGDEKLYYFGKWNLADEVKELNMTIGEALLSPTRTYAPVLIEILNKFKDQIHGIIHATGGGQTKILNFGNGIHYVKNDLFEIPLIFKIIQESSNTPWKEMYQVFNMGHRMEIVCNETVARDIIAIAKKYEINSKIIGFCEKADQQNKNSLEISMEMGTFKFNK
ncbi:MAG: AIR synthase related protein [Promethearchaeota archaeon]